MKRAPRIIVFTDLDGTLLDHDSYSYAPARPVLERMRREGIALILASSKTATEMSGLRADLGFADCPAIVENGAGLLPAGQDRPGDTATHRRLRAALDTLPAVMRAQFSGFSDWTVEQLAALTGLSPHAALRARARDFSEPGLFTGDDAERARFLSALEKAGVHAQSGGRFLTLSLGKVSKADRMAGIAAQYPLPRITVALGDAPNDTAMLETADYGIVIPNPAHAPLPMLRNEAAGRIRRAHLPGPAGWAASLSALIDELHQSTDQEV
ncbi:MAG: HAD-IIB family hydrolase [Paracoccaceae bacterium]